MARSSASESASGPFQQRRSRGRSASGQLSIAIPLPTRPQRPRQRRDMDTDAWHNRRMARPWNPDLAGVYDRVARAYAEKFFTELEQKPFDRELLDRFAADVRGRGRGCDLGCGPGHVGRYLAGRGSALPPVAPSPPRAPPPPRPSPPP